MKTFLFLVLTVVYFTCFYLVIDWFFTHVIAGVNLVWDIAAIVCMLIALAASVGLADLTLRHINRQ